ncbi:type VII secretion target [Rhodococcus sp. H36-A4]|uniref:type VII secretion target n=1 Tax=Rhodococcus sp. H36-A4 TaxID=3004353 RepID=UPI0022AFE2AE|nr:type VII secretion target [Rhodococcus sp. H36-A4]MCZ4078142.1 type VII secretion target [Rhodococcus sp. H36-A4]
MCDELDIDAEAVGAVAGAFGDSAQAIASAAEIASGFTFGPTVAGRNYGDLGVRIAAAGERVGSSLRRWSEASEDNADRFRTSVDGYRFFDDALSTGLHDPRIESTR